jgi:hypothetical protein
MRRTLQNALFALLACAIAVSAAAQATTATIRGRVTNDRGNPLASAEINAVGTQTGFVQTVKAGSDGSFTLAGLQPGEYNIVVAAPAFEARSQTFRVLVGQQLDVNFVLTPTAVINESITVVGNQLVETKTHESATNVTPQQIEALPQDDRNFLNFAAMAPGIRISANPLSKSISGDAQGAEQTNVFIDGVSFKNDVLEGGVAGQNSSRGNPFPQNAVQEFRVITQNYSAQYDHASSAIITAVTKSGGNDINGQAFLYYQPRNWVAPSEKGFQFSTLTTNESYKRYQPGISIGGPIIKDKLHFFLSYEGDQEHATTPVNVNNQAFAGQFGSFVGVFPSPFRENLGFGKLSWQPLQNQVVDLSTTYRKENEIRDFGGTTSYQSASKVVNTVYDGTLRHQWNSSSALNQASLSWQKYSWNPTALNPNLVGQDFQGAIRVGGKDTTQQFDQRRLELRDDYNFAPLDWMGSHNFQVGGNVDFMKYHVNKSLNGNPIFRYRNDPANGYTYSSPFEVGYGFGNPLFSATNREQGFYGEDKWAVHQHLGLSLGLRWDYESHMLDESYVTPANIVAGLTGKFTPPAGSSTDYFSTGSQRSAYKNEIQPRLGFTYDLRGDSKSVVFGGAGRYYDRLYLNVALEERFRLQFPTYTIQFAAPGKTPTGSQVAFDPKYLNVNELNGLIASGAAHPEIYLLNNNTKPPYSNQWNLGVRQVLGSWTGSLSYNSVKSHRGFDWVSASGTCCQSFVPGFGAVIISDPIGKSTWYSAEQVQLDRPYTGRWGAHIAYTHAKAEQNGNDLFALDLPSASLYARHPVAGSEPNHFVGTAIAGIPFDIRFSTTVTLGSGPATPVFDLSKGFDLAGHLATGVINRAVYPPKSNGFGYRNVDFRLEKSIRAIRGTSVGVSLDVLNAFNSTNYGCLSNFLGPNDNPANLGQPGCVVSLGRREQVGFKVSF